VEKIGADEWSIWEDKPWRKTTKLRLNNLIDDLRLIILEDKSERRKKKLTILSFSSVVLTGRGVK